MYFQGFGMMPSVAQVYLMEVVKESKKTVYGTIFAISISFGITLSYILGYLMRDYESVCWSFASITLILMVCVFVLPESPVWLLQTGQYQQASCSAKKLWGAEYQLEIGQDREVRWTKNFKSSYFISTLYEELHWIFNTEYCYHQ